MILKGNISIITSPEELIKASSDAAILCVSNAADERLISLTGAIGASILLPPIEASEVELDNRMDEYKNIYFMHLATNKIVCSFIALILKSLYVGKNIVLYQTIDESKMAYMPYLAMFFRSFLGITIGYKDIECEFDIRYSNAVAEAMFINDAINGEEFLLIYPIDIPLSPVIISKLITTIDPYLPKYGIIEYAEYFENFRRNTHSAGKILYDPFVKGVKLLC
jgi:hypothetical protein